MPRVGSNDQKGLGVRVVQRDRDEWLDWFPSGQVTNPGWISRIRHRLVASGIGSRERSEAVGREQADAVDSERRKESVAERKGVPEKTPAKSKNYTD